MTGYCSNSPLRCSYALKMTVLSEASNCCPECGMSLVPANSLSSSSYIEQHFLSIGLGVIALLILILIYISYIGEV